MLDQADGTPSLVLSLADGVRGEALAFNPVDRRLYHGSGAFRLRSVDPDRPRVTEIATCFDAFFGTAAAMAHLGGKTLLLADNDLRLHAVTTAGGLATIGSLGHDSGGLAFVDLPRSDFSVSQTATPDPVVAAGQTPRGASNPASFSASRARTPAAANSAADSPSRPLSL